MDEFPVGSEKEGKKSQIILVKTFRATCSGLNPEMLLYRVG